MSDYYDDNAKLFIENSFNCDMSEGYNNFLKYLKSGDSILDAGCGSGRDSLYFINKGYKVTAFDNSLSMVNFASKATGLIVEKNSFLSIDYENQFDAIWASASLLHVSRKDLPSAFKKLYSALKENGILYCSFKRRSHDFKSENRFFTCFDEVSIKRFIDELSLFNIVDIYISNDSREKRENELWVCVILKKRK